MMYWVLTSEDETIAICEDRGVAEWIADNYPTHCRVVASYVRVARYN
jgi:hypothetical protein